MISNGMQLTTNDKVQSSSREHYIDILRAIGLFLLMLAHVHPNVFVQQFRCFDVPLMLLISGYVAKYDPKEGLIKFYIKRALRLIVPVYLYLISLFSLWYLASLINLLTLPENFYSILINSFLLLNENSIGFVWIIRVFIYMMLITPLIFKLKLEPIKNVLMVIFVLTVFSVLSEIYYMSFESDSIVWILNKEVFMYAITYSIVFVVGRCMKVSNFKQFHLVFVISLLIFLLTLFFHLINSSSLIITDYKYPPRIYFITYGIVLSLIFLRTFKKFLPLNFKGSVILSFIGSNTIWIYLWHIPVQEIINSFNLHWIFKWPTLVIISCAIFYVQYIVVNKFFPLKIKKYFVG